MPHMDQSTLHLLIAMILDGIIFSFDVWFIGSDDSLKRIRLFFSFFSLFFVVLLSQP